MSWSQASRLMTATTQGSNRNHSPATIGAVAYTESTEPKTQRGRRRVLSGACYGNHQALTAATARRASRFSRRPPVGGIWGDDVPPQVVQLAQYASPVAVDVAAAPWVAHRGDQQRGDDEGDEECDDEVTRADDGGRDDAADQRAHDSEE